jgi:hypothetical protein
MKMTVLLIFGLKENRKNRTTFSKVKREKEQRVGRKKSEHVKSIYSDRIALQWKI